MKLSKEEFEVWPHKVVTLMGMSGIGKTHFSNKMKKWGWFYYSCDFQIGKYYLGDEMVETLSRELGQPVENTITPNNFRLLSQFVGQLGDPRKGGLSLDEFKRRQKLYYDAECKSTDNVSKIIALSKTKGFTKTLNDSTGSLCEIEDEDLLARLGEQSLFIYIKASEEQENEIVERAKSYPKPMFFPPSQFDAWLDDYCEEKGVSDMDDIEPDDFSRHIFLSVFNARLPKYQKLADLYGVTIPSHELHGVENEEAFFDLVKEKLD